MLFALVKLSLCACVSIALCVCMRAVHTQFTLDEIIRNNENGKLVILKSSGTHILCALCLSAWNGLNARGGGGGWLRAIESIDICRNYRKLSCNQIGYYRIISTHFSSILIRFISIFFCHELLRHERTNISSCQTK